MVFDFGSGCRHLIRSADELSLEGLLVVSFAVESEAEVCIGSDDGQLLEILANKIPNKEQRTVVGNKMNTSMLLKTTNMD